MHGGYQPITPIQLGNLLSAYFRGSLSWQGVRIALACVEMVAIREAAVRSRPRWKKGRNQFSAFKRDEAARITGLNLRAVGRGLGQLERAGLVEFSALSIKFDLKPKAEAGELVEDLSCRRSNRRLIPVPRTALRFLAREASSTVGRVMMAYWVRGLSLRRDTHEICGRGTVKSTWIADTFVLSLRAVKYAQARLRLLGWIGKDVGSKQWKLNRDGAYFQINLDWQANVLRDKPDTGIALPIALECIPVAPPIEDKFSPTEIKNQITQQKPGVYGKGRRLPKPTLRDIRREDLFDLRRLECLFQQAILRNWVRNCEADRLKFFSAAVRARSTGAAAARIFAGIVRGKLWHFVTMEQEDTARRWAVCESASVRSNAPQPQVGALISKIMSSQIRIFSTSSTAISSEVRS